MKAFIYEAEQFPVYVLTDDTGWGERCELSPFRQVFVKLAARLNTISQRMLRQAYPSDE